MRPQSRDRMRLSECASSCSRIAANGAAYLENDPGFTAVFMSSPVTDDHHVRGTMEWDCDSHADRATAGVCTKALARLSLCWGSVSGQQSVVSVAVR